jgi:hypothetical protein
MRPVKELRDLARKESDFSRYLSHRYFFILTTELNKPE